MNDLKKQLFSKFYSQKSFFFCFSFKFKKEKRKKGYLFLSCRKNKEFFSYYFFVNKLFINALIIKNFN